MITQVQRLLRLRLFREQRAKHLFEQSVIRLTQRQNEMNRASECVEEARQKRLVCMRDFETAPRGHDIAGSELMALQAKAAYFDRLILYLDSELIGAEYQHLEAQDEWVSSQRGYLLARRERERIERMLGTLRRSDEAKDAVLQEEEAAEVWRKSN